MSSWLIALQFLTQLPVRLPGMPAPEAVGRSLLWYPAVGLLLGLILWLLAAALAEVAALMQAALLLAVWVGLTGALHLDGLADSADAWLGGHGDRDRTLAIMKDPRSGPIAVVIVVLVLLLKFAALASLAESLGMALWLAPVLGRSALLGLFLTVRYVRPGGLGQALAEHLPRRSAGWVLLLVAALILLTCGSAGLVALLAVAVVGLLARRAMLRRLGGTTGDTAGALVELSECAVLVGLVLYAG